MPVWDIVGVARTALKYIFVLAVIAYVASLANTLGDMIISLWQLVSGSIDAVQSRLSGSGSGAALSCTYSLMHTLGIDTVLTSLIVGSIGVLVSWATIVAHMVMIRFVWLGKKLLLEGSK